MKTPAEWFYAVLAVVGVAAPWSFNIQWMQTSESTGGMQFIADTMVNHAASSIAVDITIVCLCFFVWMMIESRRLQMRHTWLLIPYALMVALASAFPLFLLLRSRRMRADEPGAT